MFLFVHNALRSFVQVDRDILATEHEVDELDHSVPSHLTALPASLRAADLVFCWFASLHSLGPVLGASLLRKPSVVVVGGYDTACMPEIGYGSMAHPVKRHVVRLICRTASALLVNSNAAKAEVRRHVGVPTPIEVCYHGFAPVSATLPVEREPIALSIGNVSRESLTRKGHEAFVRAAALAPELRFVLVGQCLDDAADILRRIATPNVEIVGFMPEPELNRLRSSASAYVQASAHEGFGCALAEAMLAGCIPVVSRRGALPEVAGEFGRWIDEHDPAAIARAVKEALHVSADERKAIAVSIETRFSLERRRQQLLQIVRRVAS